MGAKSSVYSREGWLFFGAHPFIHSSSTTRGPDADLSSDERSEEALEDSEDELVLKTTISDSDEDDDSSE